VFLVGEGWLDGGGLRFRVRVVGVMMDELRFPVAVSGPGFGFQVVLLYGVFFALRGG